MSESNGDSRKVIHLGMPNTGYMTNGASTGLHRATRRLEHCIRILPAPSSLPTQNMNRLWTWTLNTARKGRVDYFAMIHSDIEPPEFWLDHMLDELEAKNLDVLGAVAAIKDPRGLTSTAVAHPSGDPWRIRNRLTMKEVHRLPETFISADLGGDLLINTGLWVCKFDMTWAPKLFFTVNDRIMIDPSGDYIAQAEPEDWFVSRLFHELGLKVGCTRKIEVWHRGEIAYGNAHEWGDDAFDKEWSDKSFLDEAPEPVLAKIHTGLTHVIANGHQRTAEPPGGVVDVLVASKDGKLPAGLEFIPWKTRVLVNSSPGWANAANALLNQSAAAGHDAIFIDDDVTILPETFKGFDRYYPHADVFGFRLRGQPDGDQVGWTLQQPNPSPEKAGYLAHVTASLMYLRADALKRGPRFPVWPGLHFEDIQYTYDCWLNGFAVAYVPSLALHDIGPAEGAMVGATKRNEKQIKERRELNHRHLDLWAAEKNLRKAAEEGRIPFGVWGIDQ